MRTMKLLSLLLTLASAMPSQANLKVHEWGTFTSLVGSDGQTQDGMYHEDEDLPDFVHGFGEQFPVAQSVSKIGANIFAANPEPNPPTPPRPGDPDCENFKVCFSPDILAANVISQKMETPVIYFHTKDRLQVQVDVRFPEGVITETFPAPVKTQPNYDSLTRVAEGKTTFLVQTNPIQPLFPPVSLGNIYGHARNVDSAPIRSLGSGAPYTDEQFIFYRGLGRFQPQIDISSSQGAIHFTVPKIEQQPQAAFLVYVNQFGSSSMLRLGNLSVGNPVTVSAFQIDSLKSRVSPANTQVTRLHLIDSLVNSGLYLDEAISMIDTWEQGYLKVPGLRLLYILPEAEVNQILPLSVSPVPSEIRRSFVGRIELMTDVQEQMILTAIKRHGSSYNVGSLGRFAEPMLRRIKQIHSKDETSADRDLVSRNIDGLIARAQKGEGGVTN